MGGINESTWGSTTSHHFATPHNNNTTSPQLKTTKPTPHGQNAVHHHHRSLPCPRGRCLCPVQWHCSIWHCHGHRFRQQPRWLRSRPRHCWRCRSCFVRMPINDSLKLELSGGKGVLET